MALPRAVIARHVALGVLLLRLATAPAVAVTLGAENERPAPGAGDAYAQGAAAFEREDWQAVVDHMSRAVEERPWHDDAYNLMGFAYRKLGDYDRALEAYDRALALNPHHRGALEYLGEAYLELDQPARAKAMLDRLAVACMRTAADASGGTWQGGCEEWQELNDAYEGYLVRQEGK
jgi:tetratricopeptide (TPR) repeat protein